MAQILAMVSVMMFPKYTPRYLTDYLTHSEFRCKCISNRCDHTLVANSLLEAYKAVRLEWGQEIVVLSGFRCQIHNEAVSGTEHSSHVKGHAIDIKPEIGGSLDRLEEIARKHFTDGVVIRYETFIHCHMA